MVVVSNVYPQTVGVVSWMISKLQLEDRLVPSGLCVQGESLVREGGGGGRMAASPPLCLLFLISLSVHFRNKALNIFLYRRTCEEVEQNF